MFRRIPRPRCRKDWQRSFRVWGLGIKFSGELKVQCCALQNLWNNPKPSCSALALLLMEELLHQQGSLHIRLKFLGLEASRASFRHPTFLHRGMLGSLGRKGDPRQQISLRTLRQVTGEFILRVLVIITWG